LDVISLLSGMYSLLSITMLFDKRLIVLLSLVYIS